MIQLIIDCGSNFRIADYHMRGDWYFLVVSGDAIEDVTNWHLLRVTVGLISGASPNRISCHPLWFNKTILLLRNVKSRKYAVFTDGTEVPFILTFYHETNVSHSRSYILRRSHNIPTAVSMNDKPIPVKFIGFAIIRCYIADTLRFNMTHGILCSCHIPGWVAVRSTLCRTPLSPQLP